MEATHSSSSQTLLWRVQGPKHVDCVLRDAPDGLVLSMERGNEKEVFWTGRAVCPLTALSVSQQLRTRLMKSGWQLVHADGERLLCDSLVA